MKKRLLVSDMDHTLLNSDAVISEKNIAAIAKHVASGGLFTVATGRTWQAIRPFEALLPLVNLPVIGANGAMVCDLESGALSHMTNLDDRAVAVMTEAMEAFPELGVVTYYDRDGFTQLRGSDNVDDLMRREHRVAVPATLADCPKPWQKVLMTESRPYLQKLRAFLEPKMGDWGRLVYSEETFLEILPKQASKGAALQTILDQYGIHPDEVVAVGDAPNDLEMIQLAGMGVAVANADPAILAVADAVVGSHNDSAIAQCLAQFF